jgi:hypothetical protein
MIALPPANLLVFKERMIISLNGSSVCFEKSILSLVMHF